MKASKHLNTLFVSLLILSLVLAACSTATPVSTEAPISAPTQPIALDNPSLILATTTSTQDSGLLDVLVPDFQEDWLYSQDRCGWLW
jgi:tungstate transport system substrate-binding protein